MNRPISENLGFFLTFLKKTLFSLKPFFILPCLEQVSDISEYILKCEGEVTCEEILVFRN